MHFQGLLLLGSGRVMYGRFTYIFSNAKFGKKHQFLWVHSPIDTQVVGAKRANLFLYL